MEAQDGGRLRHAAQAGGRVLISGASFAGLATAYWMKTLGYDVTVVEIAAGLRKGGTPVDIRGETIGVVRRMGLLDAIRRKALPPRRTEFKNADDITQARIPARPAVLDSPDEEYEIDRDDLLDIMFGAVCADVDILFGTSVLRLQETSDGVSAWFSDGARQDFTLVFGCDGTRSSTRRLVFGNDEDVMHFMGLYSFLKVVDRRLIESNVTQIFSVPGKTVMLNGYDDKTDIAFGFRSDREIPYEHRDIEQQKQLIRDQFEGLGWRIPDLLKEVDAAEDFYFDKLCQIRMPAWSRGRVALVGDAGYCPSPAAGMGGSMAIIGAAALADALERHGDDHVAAFRDYDEGLRPFVEKVQEDAMSFGLTMFAPETEAAIADRDRRLAEMSAER
ncbi:FAD-dependent monooxygenase [Jiella mangrovi]|uniref:FAD-dependent monooxygenase n=1 Tax=Jiella mangrovi TaxID=2821407 RepID=A0ABS4BKL9_9HYPH|nr:FAD-dependent monooxygenase [Jiella mangrovi]MBP0616714.1 FAD-dependent monooxygenase [Jiella mangrovi]